MRKLLALFQTIVLTMFPSYPWIAAPIVLATGLMVASPAYASTVTCGLTTAGGTQIALGNAYALWTPCFTGANAAGYSVASVSINLGTVASGTAYGAVYNDSSGPHAPLCTDTTGVAVAGTSQPTTDSSLTGCGTLAANSTYWIGFEYSSPTLDTTYNSGSNCPSGSLKTYYVSNATPGTWPNPSGSGVASGCWSIYATLNVLVAATTHPPPGIMR